MTTLIDPSGEWVATDHWGEAENWDSVVGEEPDPDWVVEERGAAALESRVAMGAAAETSGLLLVLRYRFAASIELAVSLRAFSAESSSGWRRHHLHSLRLKPSSGDPLRLAELHT